MPTTYWARFDSNTANNPELNLRSNPSVQITFVPFGTNGDIILETNGGSYDPDTQVVIGGIAYNFTFQLSGTLPGPGQQGSNKVPDQFEAHQVIVINVLDYPTSGTSSRLVFLPDDTATQGEMNSFANGAIPLGNVDRTGPGVICFAAGTLILTPAGEVPVERLRAGDLVETFDHGPQPVVWSSSTVRSWPGSADNDLPVRIGANALGQGAPSRDLIVSPHHRILLLSRGGDGSGVLAPAKGLAAVPGIRRMNRCRTVTYHHLLLARHEIVVSEDLLSESFYPGPMAVSMLDPHQRHELKTLIPDIAQYGPPCRPFLTVRQTRELATEGGVRAGAFAGRRATAGV